MIDLTKLADPSQLPRRTCYICGFEYAPLLHAHHIRPKSSYGSDNPDNIALLCPNCHALVHEYHRRAYIYETLSYYDGLTKFDAWKRLQSWIESHLTLEQRASLNRLGSRDPGSPYDLEGQRQLEKRDRLIAKYVSAAEMALAKIYRLADEDSTLVNEDLAEIIVALKAARAAALNED